MGIKPLDSKVQIEKNVLSVSSVDLLILELKPAKGSNLLVPNVNRYLETEGILFSISFFYKVSQNKITSQGR